MKPYGYPDHGDWPKYREHIRVHETCMVAPHAVIGYTRPPKDGVVNLELGEESHIFSTFNILLPDARITVGKRCQLGAVHFFCTTGITVGDDAIMAWNIHILDSDHHSPHWEDRVLDVTACRADYAENPHLPIGRSQNWDVVPKKPVSIGSKVWIGCNVTIVKGVSIGEGAVIGAGSVVTRDVPPWSMGGGNPFRVKKRVPQSKGEASL